MLVGKLPAIAVWVGLALVTSGLGIGLSHGRGQASGPTAPHTVAAIRRRETPGLRMAGSLHT